MERPALRIDLPGGLGLGGFIDAVEGPEVLRQRTEEARAVSAIHFRLLLVLCLPGDVSQCGGQLRSSWLGLE